MIWWKFQLSWCFRSKYFSSHSLRIRNSSTGPQTIIINSIVYYTVRIGFFHPQPPQCHLLGLPRWLSGKESACHCRRCKRCGFDPWVKKIFWRRIGQALQYSCLENPMDRGAWQATVYRITKSQMWLSHCAHTYIYIFGIFFLPDSGFTKDSPVALFVSLLSLNSWNISHFFAC